MVVELITGTLVLLFDATRMFRGSAANRDFPVVASLIAMAVLDAPASQGRKFLLTPDAVQQ